MIRRKNFFQIMDWQWGMFHKAFPYLLLLVVFITVYEGIASYMAPLVMLESGLSKTMIGIIMSAASLFGALGDALLAHYLPNRNFKRMYLLMFIAGAAFLFIFFQSKTIPMFLLAMGVWGIYFDLRNYGHWDFVGRCIVKKHHATGFGAIYAFKSFGYIIAPMLAGWMIIDKIDSKPFVAASIFLIVGFALFLVLKAKIRQYPCIYKTAVAKKRSVRQELAVWCKLSKIIFPVLAMTFLMGILDSFFWALGPIVAEGLADLGRLRGLFIVAYHLPMILAIIFIGGLSARFGKKRLAIAAMFFGSLLLAPISLLDNGYLILAVTFFASFVMAFAWPATDGVYADYISETPQEEKEIQALGDFVSNSSYVVGPIIAGIGMDIFGNLPAISFISIALAICACALFFITPKNIKVPKL